MKVLTARWTQYLKSLQGSGGDLETEPQWAHVMRLYWGDGANGTLAPVRSEHREEQQTATPNIEVVIEKEDDGASVSIEAGDGGAERDALSSGSKRRRVAKSKTIRWSDAMTEKLFRLRCARALRTERHWCDS